MHIYPLRCVQSRLTIQSERYGVCHKEHTMTVIKDVSNQVCSSQVYFKKGI